MKDNSPVVVGLNRTTDASFCLMRDRRVEVFIRKERLTRVKHARGSLGDIAAYKSAIPAGIDRIDSIVQCFSSDDERIRADAYRRELEVELPIATDASLSEISHHFAHAYSAFYPSEEEAGIVLVVDNRGSPRSLVSDVALVRSEVGSGDLEVVTAFEARGGRLRPLLRQWWNGDDRQPVGLGMFYSLASRTLFGRYYREGVLMGLAPFGNLAALNLPPLDCRGIEVHIPYRWLEVFQDDTRFSFFRGGEGSFSAAADLAAATQQAFETALLCIARHLRTITGHEALIFAGGCALNCSANAKLLTESGFKRVFIPPACDDSGTALGCALFGLELVKGSASVEGWKKDYLGPVPTLSSSLVHDAAARHGLTVEQPDDLLDFLARELAKSEVVALFQGRSEAGPRALGNRSILADPRYDATRIFINREVKGREWFRPLAPVVRLEDATDYFGLSGPSPFMQHACKLRPAWRSRLSAVCHVDGSARVQTVTVDENPLLHALLGKVAERSGAGVLLNTSFNRRDEPIVETIDDAFASFREMPIPWLAVPPFVIAAHSKRPHPLRG